MKKFRTKISVVLLTILMATLTPLSAFAESYITLDKDPADVYYVVMGNDYTIPAKEDDDIIIGFYYDLDLGKLDDFDYIDNLEGTTIKAVESSDPKHAPATYHETDDADPMDVCVYIEEGFIGAEITVTDVNDEVSKIKLVASGTDTNKLSTPTLTAKATGSTKIKLTWTTDKKAAGYKIYRAEKKSGKYKLIKTIKNNSTKSYTNTKLKTGKSYYYKIRSYRKVSAKTEYSSYSTIKSAKPKKNVLTMGASYNYDTYGDVKVEKIKVSYNSKHRLVAKVKFYNNRAFRAVKFNWISLKVYDENGKYIGNQKFKNVKLGISPYGTKWVTFTFSSKGTKQKKAYLGGMDPEETEYIYDYDYTYTI